MFQPLVLDPRPRRLTKLLHSIELKTIGSREVTVEIPELALRYIVPTHTLIGRLLRQNGMYEEHIVNWITKRFGPDSGGMFVDVGANFGWYSCLFATIAGSNGRVFLYEPAPENIDLLIRNLALNALSNYELFEAGAGSAAETKSLHLAHHSNPGAHTLVDGLYSEGDVEVPIVTLDETIPTGPISLLKMDIEGFETEALRGGREVLSRTDAIVMEFNPSFLRRGGYDASELWGFFRHFDAFRFRFDGDPVPTGRPDDTCDLLFLRR